MDDRLFLHDNERLLASIRPATAELLVDIAKGLFEGIIAGSIMGGLAALASYAMQVLSPLPVFIVLLLLVLAGVIFRRYKLWGHATFRITTERILVHHHTNLFSSPMHTVKWNQYQESYLGKRSIFDFFFGARPLCIRYGTADAQQSVSFPGIRYAEDLKHYLDKVDSAVRKNQESTVKPFVAAPRGKRDAPSDAHA